MKKIALASLCLALLVSASGCGSESNNAAKKINKTTLESHEVYYFAGKIETNEKVTISSKIQGRVSRVMVDIGSRVKEGQPIVYIDIQDIEAQVKQAEAAVNTSKANLAKVQSGARTEQISAAQAAIDGAKTSYESAQTSLDRISKLYEGGIDSKQQVDDAKLKVDLTKSQYDVAQQQLNMLSSGETKESVAIVQAQVNQSNAALDLARVQLKNGIIVSPVSGVISSKNINSGEIASSGQQLLTVLNPGDLYVNAYVPVQMINKLKLSQDVVIKVPEIGKATFTGKVSVISSEIDSKSKDIMVKIHLNKGNSYLKPGMFAEIGLQK